MMSKPFEEVMKRINGQIEMIHNMDANTDSFVTYLVGAIPETDNPPPVPKPGDGVVGELIWLIEQQDEALSKLAQTLSRLSLLNN